MVDVFNEIISTIKDEGLYKLERSISSPQSIDILTDNGRRVLNFCANNYLGLANHPDLINAGKETITTLNGSSLFSSAESFGMIRSGRIDLTILGAMEVSQKGDIANWKIPGKMVKGMGGAMDLVASAQNIIVAMMHTNKKGESKLLRHCTLPITGISCIKKIVTNLAVIDIIDGKFVLKERAPGISIDDIIKATAGELEISNNVVEMSFD